MGMIYTTMSDILLTFGKYKNQPVDLIYEKDRDYLRWLSRQTSLNIKQDVADWLKLMFAGSDATTLMNFGKYKGKTIKHVWSVDTKYFEWLDRNEYVASSMPALKADIDKLKEME